MTNPKNRPASAPALPVFGPVRLCSGFPPPIRLNSPVPLPIPEKAAKMIRRNADNIDAAPASAIALRAAPGRYSGAAEIPCGTG